MDNSKKSVRFLIPLVAGLLVVGFTYFGSERSHAAPIPQPKPKARLRLLCTQAMNEASSDGSFSSFTLVLDPDGSAVASLVSLNETELKYLNGIIDDMNKRLAEKPIKNQQGQPATPDEIKGMRQYLENLQTVVGASGNILLQAFANPYSKAGGNKNYARYTYTSMDAKVRDAFEQILLDQYNDTTGKKVHNPMHFLIPFEVIDPKSSQTSDKPRLIKLQIQTDQGPQTELMEFHVLSTQPH